MKCTEICGVPVRPYQFLDGPTSIGVIKNVDLELSECEILENLQSDGRIARVRRFGTSGVVKLTFSSSKLPSFVLLGRVRHQVIPFRHRPIQCYNCGGFGHYAVSCNRAAACSRCAEPHPLTDFKNNKKCSSTALKCVNCGEAHEATSPTCEKWKEERNIVTYAKTHAVDYRSAKHTVMQTSGSLQNPALGLAAITLPEKSTVAQDRDVNTPEENDRPFAVALKSPERKLVKRLANIAAASTSTKPEVKVATPECTGVPAHNPVPVKPSEKREGIYTRGNSSTSAPPRSSPRTEPLKPGWVTLIRMAAEMACTYLGNIEASWASILRGFIQAALPLLNVP